MRQIEDVEIWNQNARIAKRNGESFSAEGVDLKDKDLRDYYFGDVIGLQAGQLAGRHLLRSPFRAW